jgi:hypothetical protein
LGGLVGIHFGSGESSGEEGKKWQQNPSQRGLRIHLENGFLDRMTGLTGRFM